MTRAPPDPHDWTASFGMGLGSLRPRDHADRARAGACQDVESRQVARPDPPGPTA
jgi:hypothetical protein